MFQVFCNTIFVWLFVWSHFEHAEDSEPLKLR